MLPPIQLDNRVLCERINLLISPDVVQPNPMIMHQEIKGQPKWLEVEFTHIYRCPCSGIRLEQTVEVEGEQYWLVDKESVVDFRTTDPICCANGNDVRALLSLIDDCYLSSR